MSYNFIYDGVSSEQFGTYLATSNFMNGPDRDVTRVSVPGRNGDLIIDNGCYANFPLEEHGYIKGNLICNAEELKNFLAKHQNSYYVLEESLYPDIFRLARVSSGFSMGSHGDTNGEFSIRYDCKPQCFLKSGTLPALELTSSTTPQHVVAEGKGTEIFSSAFISANTTIDYDLQYTIVDLTSLTGQCTLKLWYPAETVGSTIKYGTASPNPTTGWTSGTLSNHYVSNVLTQDDTVITDYAYFPTPLRWEVWKNGTLFDSAYSASGTLFNPTGYEAKPLIHITMSSAISNKPVALVNGYPIRITSPESNILPDSGYESMTDVYIDCETMNAYMPIGDANYNLNPYVTIPREIISLTAGENEVFVNGYIDSIEIIPRWWKL